MKSSLFLQVFLVSLLPILGTCGYDQSISLQMCYMSDISYESMDSIDNWQCTNCSVYNIQDQIGFENTVTDTQGFAGYLPNLNAIVLAFRGTEGEVDIKTDTNYKRDDLTEFKQCSRCKIHGGFNEAYRSVRPHVLSIIQNLQNKHKGASIYLTGHSLGGALAILAAIDLDQMGNDIAGVYTYGQPRVGNKHFASFVDINIPQIYRVVNYKDCVPHLPPNMMGFRHCGQEIWYHPKGMREFTPCSPENDMCSNSIDNSDLTPLNHFLKNYLKMTPNGVQVDL